MVKHKEEVLNRTFAALSEYLEDPRGVVPGMRMSFAGLPELEDRAAVIVFLNDVTGAPLPACKYS